MDEVTKKAAQNKLEFMGAEVAYPDEILDDKKLEEHYRTLALSPESYSQNMIDFFRFNTENSIKELIKSTENNDWKNRVPATKDFTSYYSNSKNAISKSQIHFHITVMGLLN